VDMEELPCDIILFRGRIKSGEKRNVMQEVECRDYITTRARICVRVISNGLDYVLLCTA
jgi:hypothetical protein